MRSKWPSCAVTPLAAELVQLLHVLPLVVPSAFEPVMMSCWFGESLRPGTRAPVSVSPVCWLIMLLAGSCSASTLSAIMSPLKLNHGPLPMRSRASIVSVLRYARHCLAAAADPAVAAAAWQNASAPSSPSASAAKFRKSPPLALPAPVMKKLKLAAAVPPPAPSGLPAASDCDDEL